MKKDWSTFTRRITANSTTRAIYNAWTIPDQIEKWFLSKARFTTRLREERPTSERAAAGDKYAWEWHGYADGSPESGTVLAANGHDFFSFTFADESIVEVLIRSEDGEKIVELTQKNISPDENLHIFIGCGEGWTFYLANLKSFLEGGIDLRNKNDKIKSVINS